MKYLLIPLTMVLWYLTAYFGLYLAVIGMIFMFELSWLWLIIIGFPFLSGIIMGILSGIPVLINLLVLRVYGINWFSCIAHSLAGVIGIVDIIRLFTANPPSLVIGNKSFFFLTGMWQTAPVKTVLLAFPFAAILMSLLWLTVIAPVYIKLWRIDIEND